MDKYSRKKYDKENQRKKEKFWNKVEIAGAALICAALVCWFGFSVYQKVEEKQKSIVTTHEINVESINDFMDTISGSDKTTVSVNNTDSSVSVNVNGGNIEEKNGEETNDEK